MQTEAPTFDIEEIAKGYRPAIENEPTQEELRQSFNYLNELAASRQREIREFGYSKKTFKLKEGRDLPYNRLTVFSPLGAGTFLSPYDGEETALLAVLDHRKGNNNKVVTYSFMLGGKKGLSLRISHLKNDGENQYSTVVTHGASRRKDSTWLQLEETDLLDLATNAAAGRYYRKL